MNDYIQEVISGSVVPSAAENDRLAKLAKNGDRDALNKLVEGNLKFVVKQVSKFRSQFGYMDEDDLFQEGICGLLRAVDSFDGTQSSFITYAFFWIRAMLLKACCRNQPVHYDHSFYGIYIRYERLRQAVGPGYTEYTDEELADYKLTRKDIQRVNTYFRKVFSYDESFNSEDDGNTYKDYISDMSYSVEDKVFKDELSSTVQNECDRLLSRREKFVISKVYGLEDDEPIRMDAITKLLAETEQSKPISRQAISRLKLCAEEKLKNSKSLKCFVDES